jgi:hypothetical protein
MPCWRTKIPDTKLNPMAKPKATAFDKKRKIKYDKDFRLPFDHKKPLLNK